MKKIVILLFVAAAFGCTHTSISDKNLLVTPSAVQSPKEFKKHPLRLNAEMTCNTSTVGATMGGVLIRTNCSNKGRIITADKIFREHGLLIEPSDDSDSPELTVKAKKLSGFIEKTTGFLNLMTLGIVPLYSHTDYIISYTSPKDQIDIRRSVRIASTQSWFSLLLSNPEGLSEAEIERRAEENLLRAVVNESLTKNVESNL